MTTLGQGYGSLSVDPQGGKGSGSLSVDPQGGKGQDVSGHRRVGAGSILVAANPYPEGLAIVQKL